MATGADFFTTPVIYHGEEFIALLDDLADLERPASPPALYLTVCPVRGERNIRFLHWLGVSLSGELESWLTEEPEQIMQRSAVHIAQCWREIVQYQREAGNPFPIGVSLAPIGRIPHATTIDLARTLLAP